MKICFLGTGSFPTANRNSQGILLQSKDTSVLVDCGEGIQRQLLKSGIEYKNLKHIFITHEHMDHIDGITGLLALLIYQGQIDQVHIYGPSDAIKVIQAKIDSCRPIISKDSYHLHTAQASKPIIISEMIIIPFDTYHTNTSLGYVLMAENKKIMCTGDIELKWLEHKPDLGRIDKLIVDGAHVGMKTLTTYLNTYENLEVYLLPVNYHNSQNDIRFRIPNDLDIIEF